jgi:hypothetical protein
MRKFGVDFLKNGVDFLKFGNAVEKSQALGQMDAKAIVAGNPFLH